MTSNLPFKFSGAAAGLAFGMVFLGIFLGVAGVFVVEKMKKIRSPENRNIMREYLNDDTKY